MHSQLVNKKKSIRDRSLQEYSMLAYQWSIQNILYKMMSKTNFCKNLEWFYQHISGKSLVNMHVIPAQKKAAYMTIPFKQRQDFFIS